jgi:tryptophan-rich hypothetical protein
MWAGSKWTAMETTFGWRHFHVHSKRRGPGKDWFLEMVSTCDETTRFWLNAKILKVGIFSRLSFKKSTNLLRAYWVYIWKGYLAMEWYAATLTSILVCVFQYRLIMWLQRTSTNSCSSRCWLCFIIRCISGQGTLGCRLAPEGRTIRHARGRRSKSYNLQGVQRMSNQAMSNVYEIRRWFAITDAWHHWRVITNFLFLSLCRASKTSLRSRLWASATTVHSIISFWKTRWILCMIEQYEINIFRTQHSRKSAGDRVIKKHGKFYWFYKIETS